ncbi:MAG: hypothetical protein ABWK05_05620 [Pyrobaculum sp.]
MWRLVLKGGELTRVEEPALLVPPGHVAVKVKAFLVDDYSLWVFKRGEGAPSRWAFGVVVANGEVGRYVVAFADNAAAQYVASRRYVYVDGPDPSLLSLVHTAYVVEALDRIPRFAAVEVLGDDPRRSVVERLAPVGRSRWKVALQGAAVEGGRVVALSRLVELAGGALVRFVDVPSRRALRKALELGVRPRVPLSREVEFGKWAVVEV